MTRTPRRPISRCRAAFLATLGLLAAACGDSNPMDPSQNANVPFSQTDLLVGSGPAAGNGQLLDVNYTGWLYDGSRSENKGRQFESGRYQFVLGTRNAIEGWDRGLVGMQVGGRRRLVIPPDLAYGSTGSGPIPPNATLVFDVELLSIQ